VVPAGALWVLIVSATRFLLHFVKPNAGDFFQFKNHVRLRENSVVSRSRKFSGRFCVFGSVTRLRENASKCRSRNITRYRFLAIFFRLRRFRVFCRSRARKKKKHFGFSVCKPGFTLVFFDRIFSVRLRRFGAISPESQITSRGFCVETPKPSTENVEPDPVGTPNVVRLRENWQKKWNRVQ